MSLACTIICLKENNFYISLLFLILLYVSGTASRLRQKTNAYHHCTVLIDVDKIKLKQALHRELVSFFFIM